MKTKIYLILNACGFLLLLTTLNPALAQHRALHLPPGIERLERRAAPSIVTAARTATAIENSSPAAPGDLDAGFGNGGIVVTPITDSPYYDSPSSMRVQPDGRIVVCGEVLEDDVYGDTYTVSFFLARYNSTGTLDTSFGTNGKVGPFGFGTELVGRDIALQPDGKIVAVGFKWNMSSSYDFAVNRYNSNGTLDTSFGTGGKVVTPVGDSFEFAFSVAVQPDGKIIVAGYSYLGGSDFAFAVVRYNPNGSLDNSFGTGGKVITAIGSNYVRVSAIVLQPNGKIVVVGGSGVGNSFTLVRYNADGSLDSEFGSNGKVIHSIENSPSSAFDGVLQPDGKIVAAGHSNWRTAIVRYDANGSIDTSFAANGIFRTESGFYVGSSIALQPDGKIVAFGGATTGFTPGFAVIRLHPNGSPDASFGTNGRLITPIGTNSTSEAVAGTLQSDGKILTLGGTRAPNSDHIALTRHLGDSASPNDIDEPTVFIRQHYVDFLNREPDAAGLAFWTDNITKCSAPARRPAAQTEAECIAMQKVTTSAAFFLSPEFQYTGYYVYRLYKGSLIKNGAGRFPTYDEFMKDARQVASGIIQNNQLSAAAIEANKKTFAEEFTKRAEFRSLYDPLSNFDYVERLFQTTGISVNATEKQTLVDGLNNQTETRASVLQKVVDGAVVIAEGNQQFTTTYGQAFYQKEFNAAFVLMEYFGYLQRDPDAAGYQHWLDKLNFYGNYIDAEMVKSFIVSPEYRARFGQP